MKNIWDFDTPPRRDEPELIDDESQPYSDFRQSMKDVQNTNSFLGGAYSVKKQAYLWFKDINNRPNNSNAPVTFLDVATGSADLPRAILKIARKKKIEVNILGLDYSAPILRFASEEVGLERGIRLIRGDAFNLPFADSSVDYALCSLAFHHWGFDRSVVAMKELERVSRKGWMVNDLRRSRSAWMLFKIVSSLTGMNRMTKHDGPASILRAYSIQEYLKMPQSMGLGNGSDFILKRSPFFRVAIIRNKISL